MSLLEQVEQDIRVRSLLKPGGRVVVAASGGLDSMVLLHVLHALARRYAWRLVVAHFNHRLRGRSSQADARLVRQTAEKLALPYAEDSGDVKQFARKEGVSIEMAAREMRHDFLVATAHRHDAKRIALGHHAHDQVELFFLRLLRGAGAGGLAGMKWANPSPADPKVTLIRPLLDQPKTTLEQYAQEQKIKFREDATNAGLDILRNRIRHKLLPFLRREFQPALDAVVLRQMNILEAEDDFLTAAMEGRGQGRGGDPFDQWPVALQRRFLQQQLQQLNFPAEFHLIELLRVNSGKKIMAAQGVTVRRDPSGVVRTGQGAAAQFPEDALSVRLHRNAGPVVFAGRAFQWAVLRQTKAGLPHPRPGCEWFDADKVGAEIMLRHWRPGDRFQPIGMRQAVKLQDLFTNLKIPAGERHRLVVACTAGGEIWWVEGLRLAERFKIGARTKRRLKWVWTRQIAVRAGARPVTR